MTSGEAGVRSGASSKASGGCSYVVPVQYVQLLRPPPVSQALAPVPGVSRSGVTITAALLLGLGRQAAARFSFLLSIPIIASAGALKAWELASAAAPARWDILVLGAGLSGITAYLCIALFLRLLDRVGLMPFVYYRVLLALVLFAVWLR